MATMRSDPPSHKLLRLGSELRALRIEANETLHHVAGALGARWDTSRLSKIERAKLPIGKADLERLLDHYEVQGEDRVELLDLLTDGPSVKWWRDPEFAPVITPAFAEFLSLEAEASETLEYTAGSTFPGLVQTGRYAAEAIGAGIDGPGDDQIESGAKVRTLRQRRLTDEPPLKHTAYFSEVALLLKGDLDILADQIRHAVNVADFDHVTLRMVPLDAGRRGVLASGLVLMRFTEPAAQHVFLEAVGGMLNRGSGREVRRAERAFERLDRLALSSQDTIAALQKKLEEIS
ncbi:helix-turn-helix domain-containing protein [Kitasatospora sp. NPDC057541]|uniref:helix-turn-helix domain-containing protein n=1 Tax=unclassified Kitasatospora TaxID=2633591 RepID=UPI0036A05992